MKREKNDKEVFFLKTEIGPEQCLMYRDVREHGLIGALGGSGLINEQIGYKAQLLRNASDLNGTAARKRAQD
ncbi:hypothetical protein WL94_22710 [Burkholderia cepacia]|nr:hypothetical protein WL94_22710 [Burkholderia cepacia]